MTFSANHVDELISASLTGDLTDAERAQMDAHLARCEKCRATLAAFKAERRILAALPPADPPRDLSARVRAGIESGPLGGPWWRRPFGLAAIGVSGVSVAAVVLALVVLNNQPAPVGQASESPQATLSLGPSASAAESPGASTGPSTPPTFLAAGQLGYLELSGAPFEASKLSFINDATGASLDLGTVSGPPTAASLSPDGQWLAYITQKGETGANEVRVLRLADGRVTPLGCSLATPFADRLAWSPDSQELGFTLVAVDLGPDDGCLPNDSPTGSADVWVYLVPDDAPYLVAGGGNSYAGSFVPGSFLGQGEPPALLISHAGETPWTSAVVPFSECPCERIDGVFLPLVSPDGNRAIFWNGTMAQGADGVWQFSRGGMPQLSGDFRAAGPASPWAGTPLFTDLVPVGGEAFASGDFAWGADSLRIAFWNGRWTGAPQSSDGTYPSDSDLYLGSVNGLSVDSRFAPGLTDKGTIVDVTYSPSGDVAVTLGYPSAGIGDPPSATITVFPSCCGADARVIGGGVDPPPSDGPAVFGR
jgi:hypothetical protein